MANWSGKRKPKNKIKRKSKAQKRLTRQGQHMPSTSSASSSRQQRPRKLSDAKAAAKPERARSGDSKHATAGSEIAEPKKKEGVRKTDESPAPLAVEQHGFVAKLKSKWNSLTPQTRVGTVLGVVIVAIVSAVALIKSSPKPDVSGGRIPSAAPIAQPTDEVLEVPKLSPVPLPDLPPSVSATASADELSGAPSGIPSAPGQSPAEKGPQPSDTKVQPQQPKTENEHKSQPTPPVAPKPASKPAPEPESKPAQKPPVQTPPKTNQTTKPPAPPRAADEDNPY